MCIVPVGILGSGYSSTGCLKELNMLCPPELAVKEKGH